MKRGIVAWILTVCLLLVTVCAEEAPEAESPVPAAHVITMRTEEWDVNGTPVRADVPRTVRADVNIEIRKALRSLRSEAEPVLAAYAATTSDPEEYELELMSTYRVSGESWAGFLFTARIFRNGLSVNRNFEVEDTVWLRYNVCAFDLADGRPLTVNDLFTDGVPQSVCDAAAQRIREYYPAIDHDEAKIAELTSPEAIGAMPFLPGAARLLLTFPLDEICGKPQLCQVTIEYRSIRQGMNEEALKQTDNSGRPVIALTYDDGPALGNTKTLLRFLNCYGASVTFFPIGQQVNKWPEAVRRELDYGHSVGCHTMNHVYTYKIHKSQEMFDDREACIAQHTELVGPAPTLFRAPGGGEEKYIKYEVGWPLIHWNQSAGDTGNGRPKWLSERNVKLAESGNIVLMHDIHDGSVVNADIYLSGLAEQGYLFVTVEELMAINDITIEPNHIYSSGAGIDTERELSELNKKN